MSDIYHGREKGGQEMGDGVEGDWHAQCIQKNNPSLTSNQASLVVQWLRLLTPNAGGLGLIPGQGTRSCVSQLRPNTAKKYIYFLREKIKN